MQKRSIGVILALLGILPAASATAQVEVAGNFIQYMGVRANGVLLNESGRSMQYGEDGAAGELGCDLYSDARGSLSRFRVETIDAPGGSPWSDMNNAQAATNIVTTGATTPNDRQITWSGTYLSYNFESLEVAKTFTFADRDDRFVRVDVELTNPTAAVTFTEVYYAPEGSPGLPARSCPLGLPTRDTGRDVLRQPPAQAAALAVAASPVNDALWVGLGAFDAAARAFNSKLGDAQDNRNLNVIWKSPLDGGMAEDLGSIGLVFKVGTLAPGESRKISYFYVWALDQVTLEARFDALICAGRAEGATCTPEPGVSGSCRSGVCCTGCWDGAACSTGDQVAQCGTGGAICTDCTDGDPCTADSCVAGSCQNATLPEGESCDDGQLCTENSSCDASGSCVGGTRSTCDDGLNCTADSCDDSDGSCTNLAEADSCAIDGACHARDAEHPTEPCLICDPDQSATAWSPAPSSKVCDDGSVCTVDDRCDGTGTCAPGAAGCDDGLACTTDSGSCDPISGCPAATVDDGWCVLNNSCVAEGTPNPANPCERCDPAQSQSAWSPSPAGTVCDDMLFCNGPADACDGTGQCVGTGVDPCDRDRLNCTSGECDEDSDSCGPETVDSSRCLIAGVCYGEGDFNPADGCERCVSASADQDWTPSAPGAACEDGDPCTVEETCNASGRCVGGNPNRCDDGLDCTADSCQDGQGCVNAVASGFCAVDGACHANNTVNPENPCEACVQGLSRKAWTPRADGIPCDDTLACTINDRCDGAGACVGFTRTCNDGAGCTTDACDEVSGGCSYTVVAGSCQIDGACFADGDRNPTNSCEQCASSQDPAAWSRVPDGSACDDGRFCTTGESCNAGLCGGSSARNCVDALTCTADSCDEMAKECVHQTTASFCVIGAACVPGGTAHPSNSCLACQPGVDQSAYSPVVGQSCDDGTFCTTGDACNEAGACAGAAIDCDDGMACTLDLCVEESAMCSSDLLPGFCRIDGRCYGDGERNPDNACEVCDASAATDAWTAREAGSQCGDPSCLEGELQRAATCDDGATCVPGETLPCSGGECADEVSCSGECAEDLDCLESEHCTADAECSADFAGGLGCDRDAMCASDFCADGVCCDGPCQGSCESCDQVDALGSCRPHRAGEDPELECATNAACDGAGQCAVIVPDAGMPDAEADAGVADGSVDASDGAADGGDGGADGGLDGSTDSGADVSDDGSVIVDGSEGDTSFGAKSSDGCGCRTAPGAPRSSMALLPFFGLLLGLGRRRRRSVRRRR